MAEEKKTKMDPGFGRGGVQLMVAFFRSRSLRRWKYFTAGQVQEMELGQQARDGSF
jgi:hypothetical protein